MGCCSSDSKVTVDPNSVPEKPGTNKGGGQHRRVPSDSKSKIPKYEAGGPEDQWIKAVEANDNKKIKHLVKQYHKKVKFIKIRFENGDNSLHCAVRSNNNKLVKFLLLMKMSEKINDKSLFNGNTALHYAVMNNKEGMVKTLIANHNIKLDIKNSKGETPLDIAKKQDDKHIASLLEKHLKLDDESIARLTNNIDNPSTDRDGNNNNNNNNNKDSSSKSKIHHKVANSQSSNTMGDDNDDNKMNSYKETNNNNNNNKNDFANIMRDDSKSKSNNKNNKKNTSNNAVRVEPDSDEKESSRTGTGGGGGGGSGAGLELDTTQPPSNVLNIIDQTTPIDDDDDDETDTSRQSSNYKYNENSDNEDNIISNNNDNNNNNNNENSGDLPVLEGMLEKKRSKAPSIYQKRWVQVKKPYIFWNEKKFDVQDVTSKKEREKANGCIKFDDIANVTKKKSKSEQTKFIINIRKSNDKKDDRQMTFRCSSEAIRDEWVEGLQKYLDF